MKRKGKSLLCKCNCSHRIEEWEHMRGPVEKTMVSQAVPCSPRGSTGMRRPAAPEGDSCQSRWMRERRLWIYGRPVLEQTPGRDLKTRERGTHSAAGFPVVFVTPWGNHIGATHLWRTAPHGRVTHIAVVLGGVLPVEWAHVGEVHGELLLIGGAPQWGRGRTPLPEQRQKQPVMTITPTHGFPVLLGQRDGAGKEEGMGRMCF